MGTFQERRKWTEHKRNIQEGDVVLLRNKDSQRNDWPVAVVTAAAPNTDGLTRKVKVRDARGHTFFRPIAELVLLLEGSPRKQN